MHKMEENIPVCRWQKKKKKGKNKVVKHCAKSHWNSMLWIAGFLHALCRMVNGTQAHSSLCTARSTFIETSSFGLALEGFQSQIHWREEPLKKKNKILTNPQRTHAPPEVGSPPKNWLVKLMVTFAWWPPSSTEFQGQWGSILTCSKHLAWQK